MKKVIIIVICVLAVPSVVFIITCWIPAKFAVRPSQFLQYKNCIIVKEVYYTGTGWAQIGDEHGYFEKTDYKDVILSGKELPDASISRTPTDFLCMVEYKGQVRNPVDSESLINSYKVIDWYPVYPIKRDVPFPSWILPRGFLAKRELKSY